MGFLSLLLPILSLVSLVGYIWLVRNAFRTSTGWGIAVLFLSPFSAVIYAIKNWEDSRKPFLVYSGSTVAGIAVIVMMFAAMGGFEAVAMANSMASGEITDEQAAEFITGQMDRIEKSGMLDAQGQSDLAKMRGMMNELGGDTADADGSVGDEGAGTDRPLISDPVADSGAEPGDEPDADDIMTLALRARTQEVSRGVQAPAGPIRVGDAGRYIGARMTAIGTDGIAHTGKLASADGGVLWFEKYFSGGTFSVELKASQIRSLEILE